MIRCNGSCANVLAMLVVISILIITATPIQADKSAVKMTKLEGMLDLTALGPSPYALEGIASHLGKFRASAEVEFGSGEEGRIDDRNGAGCFSGGERRPTGRSRDLDR